ncbi:hypothetical protein HK104_003620 [Borealophlyctis nickersoniae]|nr:hypothetical protein HK104_003620 [Borealophlyctis nickersoniae]
MPSSAGYIIEKGVAQSVGSRKYQEDEWSVHDNLQSGVSVYTVFDGHGSGEYSHHAAQVLPKLLIEHDEFKQGRYDKALKDTFLEEDKKMAKELDEKKGIKRGGTTATVAVVAGDQLYVANVGDSRAVIAEKQGTSPDGVALYNAVRLSKDHKVTDDSEAKRLDDAGAKVRSDRVITAGHGINMSRALGDFDFKQVRNDAPGDWISPVPHISAIKLTPNHEFLVLASDGLWTFLDEYGVIPAVAELRGQGCTAQQIADKFVEKLGKAPFADNTTVIVLFFQWKEQQQEQQ